MQDPHPRASPRRLEGTSHELRTWSAQFLPRRIARAIRAGVRNESGLLELMSKPLGESKKGGMGAVYSTGTLTGFGSAVRLFLGDPASSAPAFRFAAAKSALTSP